jgi:hypothetical protein
VNTAYCLSGFTILDNVIMYSGKFYVVVDDATSMPSAELIGSSRVNQRDIEWQIFPARDALSEFGSYGGRCVLHPFVKADSVS